MTTGIAGQETLATSIERDGWAVTGPVVPQLVLDQLAEELDRIGAATERPGARGGMRNLLEVAPGVRTLARAPVVRSLAEAVLGPRCFAVRALLLEKTSEANRTIHWHQDVTIAVAERAIVHGFGPWSDEEGVPHVQPPTDLLERMLVVRVHLDDCGPANGPLRVLSGSHRVGRLSAAAIEHWRAAQADVECVAERGAILAFRPLILHASSRATAPARRRIVHLDFAAESLPAPLSWHSTA